LCVLKQLGFPQIKRQPVFWAFEETKWAGRFEVLSKNPFVLLDGAHNPDGAAALRNSLETYFPGERFCYIFGVFRDKDYAGILEQMLPLADRVYTVKAPGERGMDSGVLAKKICDMAKERNRTLMVQNCGSVEAALSCIKADKKKTIVFGSLSFLREVYSTDTFLT
jgi:dihydrofolate synthase/folylpolyglutamate synthase